MEILQNTRKLNLVILDDEKPAIQILSNFSGKVSSLNLLLATNDPIEAREFILSNPVDLVFTDISMPDLSGVELVRSLPEEIMVIFITAFDEFALEGYELNVVDYLVKPLRFERFIKAIQKAEQLFEYRQQSVNTAKEEFLTIKAAYKTVRIPLEDILYVEGLKDYVKIYTIDKMYMTRLNLKGVSSRLPEKDFLRIHRSYIVSIGKITKYQQSKIFISTVELPIGKSYQEQVLQLFN